MYAQVITHIKRQQKRGQRPRLVQHGRGYVGLSQWMGRGLALKIEQHNHQVRKALRERLLAMKPGEFQELISQLLAEMGFEMVGAHSDTEGFPLDEIALRALYTGSCFPSIGSGDTALNRSGVSKTGACFTDTERRSGLPTE